MKLFEYVILRRIKGYKDSTGNDVPEQLKVVQDVKRGVFKDEKVATLTAAREIPEDYLPYIDEVEIAIRPF